MNDLKFYIPKKNEPIAIKLLGSFDINSLMPWTILKLNYKKVPCKIVLGKG